MSLAAAEALDRRALPWLFATALATTLPQIPYQPAWISGLAATTFTGAAWTWWRGTRLPGRWLLLFLVAGACTGILFEFHTLFGRAAGVATLLLLMAMKLLEIRSRRDAYVIINLGYFLLLTHYFNSQSILTGVWLLAALTIVTASLIRLHGGPAIPPWATLRQAGQMVLQALPFMLILYVLFPRVTGPLWGLPQDAFASKSGLSDQMAPGTIANLALSDEIAFRARFVGKVPNNSNLYWRGPVMDDYDGQTWRQRPAGANVPKIEALGLPLKYEVTLEPHSQRWLLALEAPTELPPDALLAPSMAVLSRLPLQQRQRYTLSSAPSYRYNVEESDSVLKRTLQLPPGRNPRTRALAEDWRRADPGPERLVQRALDYFRTSGFVYSLQPGLLGEHPVDDFLFQSREGFCEHYASAFVVLMRASGVPARVVGGYQGGEINPIDGYLVVRQSDAHAWAEVWLAGRGWVRVDPTAVVAPARIQSGLPRSLRANDPLPALLQLDADWLRNLRYRWDAASNAWNQWVLGYNPQRQRELMSRFGLPDADWRTLAPILLAACTALLLGMTVWALYKHPPADPALRLWRRALARLRRQQVICEPWETPFALASRLRIERPELAGLMEAVAASYCDARYGTGTTEAQEASRTDQLRKLRAAVARLP